MTDIKILVALNLINISYRNYKINFLKRRISNLLDEIIKVPCKNLNDKINNFKNTLIDLKKAIFKEKDFLMYLNQVKAHLHTYEKQRNRTYSILLELEPKSLRALQNEAQYPKAKKAIQNAIDIIDEIENQIQETIQTPFRNCMEKRKKSFVVQEMLVNRKS